MSFIDKKAYSLPSENIVYDLSGVLQPIKYGWLAYFRLKNIWKTNHFEFEKFQTLILVSSAEISVFRFFQIFF